MGTVICLLLVTTSFLTSVPAWGNKVPKGIGGIVLGSSIDQYRDMLIEGTALPIRHMECLTEVEIKPPKGYRSGYVTHANCEKPGQIVRIRLKYANETKEFYEELLTRFTQALGKPSEYRGDPFRAFLAWKWSFSGEKGERVSLTLQHNSVEDEDYSTGTMLKMSLISQIEKERATYEKTRKQRERKDEETSEADEKSPVDFHNLVPE
ncbi:MAG: hypothetical protein GX443_02255 [Deltaproteobacteria bacterium]|nr:hypothetical protein [Deltaproteobacteria bacterium]